MIPRDENGKPHTVHGLPWFTNDLQTGGPKVDGRKSESLVDRWVFPMTFDGFQPSQIGGLSDFAAPSTVSCFGYLR